MTIACDLHTDPAGSWLKIPTHQLPPVADIFLASGGDHRMTRRHVYIDDETLGPAIMESLDLKIRSHVHDDRYSPVRNMLPYDMTLARIGLTGAKITMMDQTSGRVLTVAPVKIAGEPGLQDCMLITGDLGGIDPGKEKRLFCVIPLDRAALWVQSIVPRAEATNDLSPAAPALGPSGLDLAAKLAVLRQGAPPPDQASSDVLKMP